MKTNKLVRIIGLVILFTILYILGLIIIPSIVWLFGGSFLEILQHPLYIMFISIFLFISIGILFSITIDGETFEFID